MLLKSMFVGLIVSLSFTPAAPLRAQERTLVWADAGEPSTLDPAKANIDWEINITRNIYDPLTTYDYDAPNKILPALATSWENDGTSWTFKLRPGVKFHNGQPFSADDVKATIDRALALGQGQSYLINDISSVTVIDPLTVKIETKRLNVYLPSNLSHIEIASAADIKAHADDKAEAFFNENANGTGPYKLVGWTRGSHVELARNAEWWGKFADNPYDRILDQFVGEASTRARGLEGGEYDLANYVPLDDSTRIAGMDGFKRVEGQYLWVWPTIYLNTKLAPTDNPAFREALVKSFNYDAMKQFFGGLAATPKGPIPDWYPESPEKDEVPISRDLKAAKALLEKSGMAGASMKCVIPSGFAEFAFAATVLQASASEIGVNVQIEQAPFAEAIAATKDGRSNCFAIGNANLAPTDVTKFFAAHYLTGGFFNTANYSNPKLDQMMSKISEVFDANERYNLIKQAAQMVIDDHIVIWTARPTTVFAVPKKVMGYKVNPTDYTGVRFYTLGAAQE